MNPTTRWLFETVPSLNVRLDNSLESVSGFEWEAAGEVNCSQVATDCVAMTPQEQRRVKPGQNPAGDFEPRRDLMKNSDVSLAIQLVDYDVNDWLLRKRKHQEGLTTISEFLMQRASQITASPNGIEITITGKASRTGAKEYNDILSCKRALCVVRWFQQLLSPALLRKIKFNISGKGFQESSCRGSECELPQHRSVLVVAHRPGVQPPPVPVTPPGWNKYKIRCCSFKTESLGEAFLGDLLSKGVDQLPEPLRGKLRQGMGKSVLDKLVKKLAQKLGKKLGSAIDKVLGEGLLKFIPIEFIQDTGVFQIVEREVAQPKDTVLCYKGIGLRVKLPRKDLIPKVVKIDVVKRWIKEAVKDAFNLRNVPGIDQKLEQYFNLNPVPTIETTSPGPFTDFNVDRNIPLRVFAGFASVMKGLEPGRIYVGFGRQGSRPWFHPDPWQRPKITCAGCATPIVPVRVGSPLGFEVVAPTEGELAERGCKCGVIATRTAFRRRRV